jgi:hypothetical protein
MGVLKGVYTGVLKGVLDFQESLCIQAFQPPHGSAERKN